jgi:hypothetical protein
VREFETEADTSLTEAETALYEARAAPDHERPRQVAAALRRAADAVERFVTGDLTYDAEELRRLAVQWEKGYPDPETYDSDLAVLRDISLRVIEAGRSPESGTRGLGAPEAE